MQRLKILIFLYIFLNNLIELKAQTNFLKGYYIINDKDTIHGYIDYRSERRNYRLCVYKKDHNSSPATLYPRDISGFVVEGKNFYETHSFQSRTGEQLHGFFNVLVRGRLSLLRYQSRYFAKDPTGEIFEISRTTKEMAGKTGVDYFGLGMLKVLMQDCQEVAGSILEKEYRLGTDFVPFFEKYNRCVGSEFYTTRPITIRPHLDPGIVMSAGIASLDLGYPAASSFESKPVAEGGAYASIFIPRLDERIRLVIGISYGRWRQYSFFEQGNTNNDLIIDVDFLKMPVVLRYSTARFFFDVGIQNQFMMRQEMIWRIETFRQDGIYTDNGDLTPFNFRSSGYLAGVGILLRIADREIRPSCRFSKLIVPGHPLDPTFQTIELNLMMQLTR